MKKYIYKIGTFLLLSVCLLVGCNNKLDIKPIDSILAEEALTTSGGVEGTLVGAYATMGSANLYGGRLYVNPDLLADDGDVIFTGTFQGLVQIWNKLIPIDNDYVELTWLAAYRTINVTNNVLGALDVVATAKKARVEAEAKFIRGSMYFELVKLYAKTYQDGNPSTNLGVPLVLTPTKVPGYLIDKPARNTVAEVYAQVIKDLTEAEAALPTTNGFFATKYAAAAMLSRVYLMQGDYVNARDAANRVIISNRYGLIFDFLEEFPYPGRIPARAVDTSEDVFAQQVNEQNGVNSMNEFYATSTDGGRGDIEMTDQHLNRYEVGDRRYDIFFSDAGSIRTDKFSNQYGNIKIIRLAEMYLTRAECNLRLGTTTGSTPLNDVNLIRERAGLDPFVGVTLGDILNERYLELSFEGQTLHDIKRTQGSVGSLQWNSPKLVFPIPQRETIANPNLVQNEGYTLP